MNRSQEKKIPRRKNRRNQQKLLVPCKDYYQNIVHHGKKDKER